MLSAKKRGSTYRIEGVLDGQYLRLTLGTRDRSSAILRVGQLDCGR